MGHVACDHNRELGPALGQPGGESHERSQPFLGVPDDPDD
jgi:hypothetical protein